MSRKDREFWNSAWLNNRAYQYYYDKMVELAISSFEWKNLPDTIDSRFLELTLFRYGHCVFFYDDVIGHLALPSANSSPLDVYGIPINRNAYSVNGYSKLVTNKDSVLIFNNQLHTSSMQVAEMFARKMYNIDRAIDVNANAQKTPILVTCDQSQRLTMLNLYKEYDGNTPVIFGDNNLKENSVRALTTNAPFVAQQLYELKTSIWNEALTAMGISSVPFEKRERLLVSEVSQGQGESNIAKESRLKARKRACEQINKMFGLEVDVEFSKPETQDEELLRQILGRQDLLKQAQEQGDGGEDE